jgi:integrative and conjugative element protein (TIGR02256 family)
MSASWITLHPLHYVKERKMLERHYPGFKVDEARLAQGHLRLYGEIVVRPPGGPHRHTVRIDYPSGFPFELPVVTPLQAGPQWDEEGNATTDPLAEFLDHRHQMPGGSLCLFQKETRLPSDEAVLTGVDVLRRAGRYLLGHYTGHWPPDTADSELESHFLQAGDVLLPSSFYQMELGGFGRLFLVLDFGRVAMSEARSDPPFIVTALTEESRAVIRPFDGRTELTRLYPWIGNAAWDASPRAAAMQDVMKQDDRFHHGYWWSLPREPRPFRDGAGLIRELSVLSPEDGGWSVVKSLLGPDLLTAEYHFFGLQYPSRDSGNDWLVVYMPRDNVKEHGGIRITSDADQRQAFEAAPVRILRAHRLEQSVLRRRNTGVVREDIREKSVSLIGLGALGSSVAEMLAKAGVGHFRLCDYDRLSIGNVARHVGRIRDFGLPKTEVVISRLLDINPYLEFGDNDVAPWATSSSDLLDKFISGTDLTICTTADEGVESFINQMAVIGEHPTLYGRSLRSASMGRIFLVRPRRDACKACLGAYLRDGRDGTEDTPEDWIDIPEDEQGLLLHECGRPVIAGSAVDLASISTLIARVALDLLEGRETEMNHWVWSSRSAPDVDPRLTSRFVVVEGRVPPRPNCPACQEPDVVQLLLSEEAHDAIVAETESRVDVETGGILIGFVDQEGTAIVVRATGPGPNAKHSRLEFRRDVEYAQGEIQRAADELGDKGLYVGEWHSHLVPDPQPSAIDVDSLFGISAVSHYLTRCPALVIAGLDTATGKVSCLRSWSFPVGGRVYEIVNDIDPDIALP